MEVTNGRAGKRVCLLTGASSPLGRSFIATYRGEYDIVAVYHRTRPWFPSQDVRIVDPLQFEEELPENRDPIYALSADLRDPAAATGVVEQALTRFDVVDVLVNAAAATVWAPVLAGPRLADSVRDQFALAVEAPLRLVAALSQGCWQRDVEVNRARNRNVVNVSSIAALHVYRGSGQSVYAAAKAAMNHLTAHLSVELAPLGVRANATAANSFPAIVPVERAVRAIRELDAGEDNGTLVVVDGEHDERRSLDV